MQLFQRLPSEEDVSTQPRPPHGHAHKGRLKRSWRVAAFYLTFSAVMFTLGLILLSNSIAGNIGSLTATRRIPITTAIPALDRPITSTLYTACLTYDHDIKIPVNFTEIIDLTIAVCPRGNKNDTTSPAATPSVRVGGIVDAILESNTLGTTITPIGNSTQPIDESHEGTWSWKVTPTQPGDFILALVITAYDAEQRAVLLRNKPISIALNVTKTVEYRIDKVKTSLGVGVGLLGAIGGIKSGVDLFQAVRGWRRQAKQ